MSYGSRIRFLNAKLLATFAFVVSLAFLLMPESALAAVFNAQSPGISAVATLSPSTVSVNVADTVALLGTPIMLVDGTPRPATLSYVVITPGYWYWDEYDGVNYWNPPVYDYKRGTVSCSPGVLSDGPHSASVTLANGTAPTTTTWSFSVAEKPAFSAMTPASGTTTKTVNPLITAKVTDNTSVATCTATIDGIAFPVTYDSGTKVLSINPGNLKNFANHTVSLRAVDAAGNVGTTAWTFTVNGPETTWTNVFPAPGTTLTYSPWYVGVDVTCTSPFLYTTRKVVFDGVVDSSAVWISPIKGDTKTGKIYGYPKAAAQDGTHTVTTSVSNTGGTTASYTWSFGVRVPPTMGSPSPAAKSYVTTTMPSISIPATDNSAVTSVTAVVNGVATPATYDAANGVARVSLQSPLPDDDDTTVTVRAYDALGLSVSTTWTFEVQTGAVMSGNADNCFSCHPAAYIDSTMGTPCEWCHSKHLDPSTSWHPRADITGCRPCHRSQLLIEHNRPGLTCATCHNSSDSKVKKAILLGDTKCTSCHGDLGAAHLSVHESAVASTTLVGTSVTCGDCHYPNLVTEHALPNASSATAGCANCHPAPRNSITSWAKDCVTAGCHVVGSTAQMHRNQDASHVRPAGSNLCFTSGCHLDQSLPAIHSVTGCLACHGRGIKATGVCLTCHVKLAEMHPAAPHVGTDAAYARVAGSGCGDAGPEKTNCHDISNVAILHSKLPESGCAICHVAPNTPKTECLDCHHYDGSTTYGRPDPGTLSVEAYPSADISVTPGLAYITTPTGRPRYSVVNTAYPSTTPTSYVTITSTTAGGVLFDLDQSKSLVPSNAVILEVAVYAKGKADKGDQREMRGLFRIGGRDFQNGPASLVPTDFPASGPGTALKAPASPVNDAVRDLWLGEACSLNPKTGGRWTAAQVNGVDATSSLEAYGVAISSSTAANSVSLSQVYLRVTYYTMTPAPTVGTLAYHHNNVKYLYDSRDAGGKKFGFGNGYDALFYQDCFDFCHYGMAVSEDFSADQGSWMWYSVGGDPDDTLAGTRTLTLNTITLPSGSSTLTFTTNYDLSGTSAGYVEASEDGGISWMPLQGRVNGTLKSSLSGTSLGWVSASYDLSYYAGQAVKIRFRYVNGNSRSAGWAFDRLRITGGGRELFSDDAETLKPEWTSSLWTRSKHAFPWIR